MRSQKTLLLILWIAVLFITLFSQGESVSAILQNYTFNNTVNNTAYRNSDSTPIAYPTAPTWSDVWTGVSGLTATEYYYISTENGVSQSSGSTGLERDPSFLFWFDLNETNWNNDLSRVEWMQIRLTGSENADSELAHCYLTNFSSFTYFNIGNFSGTTLQNITVNYTGTALYQIMDQNSFSRDSRLYIYCYGNNFDSAESLSIDYVEILISYLPIYRPSIKMPDATKTTFFGDFRWVLKY